MVDRSELKRLAEACKGWSNLASCWPVEVEDGAGALGRRHAADDQHG